MKKLMAIVLLLGLVSPYTMAAEGEKQDVDCDKIFEGSGAKSASTTPVPGQESDSTSTTNE